MIPKRSFEKFFATLRNEPKRILYYLTPPIVGKLFQRFKSQQATSPITYEGVYTSFEEVLTKYGVQPGYSTPELRSQAAQNATNIKSLIDNNSKVDPTWSNIRFNFFSSFISGLAKEKLCILDIGGGYVNLICT